MILDSIACGSDGKVHITGHVAILPKPGLTINQVKLTNFNVTNYSGATVNTSLSLPFTLSASGNNYPFSFIVNDNLCNKILHIGYLISSTCAGTGNTNITDCFKDTIMPCCTIPPDCCKNGKWKEKFIVENGVKKDLPCGSSFAATFQCNTTKTFLVSYSCNPNCATPAQIEYGIYNGSSGAQVGTSTIVSSGTLATITMPSTAGYYCLKIYAKCGGKICDSCIVCFKVACVEDCCKGSKWGDQYIEGVQKVICGTNIPTMACNATRKVVFNYICNPNLPIPCKASIDYIIKDYASGAIVSSISNIASGTSTIITAPATPGYYCLTVYAKCNGYICDSCKVCFKVDCQPDCCKGGSWGEKLRINDNGTSTKLDSCGSDLGIAPCGYTGKLNVTYNCNPACSTKAQIVYQ